MSGARAGIKVAVVPSIGALAIQIVTSCRAPRSTAAQSPTSREEQRRGGAGANTRSGLRPIAPGVGWRLTVGGECEWRVAAGRQTGRPRRLLLAPAPAGLLP